MKRMGIKEEIKRKRMQRGDGEKRNEKKRWRERHACNGR